MNQRRSHHQFKLREFYRSLQDNFLTRWVKTELAIIPAFNLMRTDWVVGQTLDKFIRQYPFDFAGPAVCGNLIFCVHFLEGDHTLIYNT